MDVTYEGYLDRAIADAVGEDGAPFCGMADDLSSVGWRGLGGL